MAGTACAVRGSATQTGSNIVAQTEGELQGFFDDKFAGEPVRNQRVWKIWTVSEYASLATPK